MAMYRETTLGLTFKETLAAFIDEGTMTPEQAKSALETFDRVRIASSCSIACSLCFLQARPSAPFRPPCLALSLLLSFSFSFSIFLLYILRRSFWV